MKKTSQNNFKLMDPYLILIKQKSLQKYRVQRSIEIKMKVEFLLVIPPYCLCNNFIETQISYENMPF